jgi:hypothetical protein
MSNMPGRRVCAVLLCSTCHAWVCQCVVVTVPQMQYLAEGAEDGEAFVRTLRKVVTDLFSYALEDDADSGGSDLHAK